MLTFFCVTFKLYFLSVLCPPLPLLIPRDCNVTTRVAGVRHATVCSSINRYSTCIEALIDSLTAVCASSVSWVYAMVEWWWLANQLTDWLWLSVCDAQAPLLKFLYNKLQGYRFINHYTANAVMLVIIFFLSSFSLSTPSPLISFFSLLFLPFPSLLLYFFFLGVEAG